MWNSSHNPSTHSSTLIFILLLLPRLFFALFTNWKSYHAEQWFQVELLLSSTSGNSKMKLPCVFWIPNCVTPHALRIPVQETPLPLSSKMLLVLLVWSFSGITQWVITQSSNNHLVQSTSGSQSDSPIAVLYFPRNGQCVEIISCTWFLLNSKNFAFRFYGKKCYFWYGPTFSNFSFFSFDNVRHECTVNTKLAITCEQALYLGLAWVKINLTWGPNRELTRRLS